ncbi:hypothetical protein Naga_100890g1 [Nannochloropsis gaditana]|uniref:Uncharacterized protein n=1 Tax=Nannochloropsis gaditana TaxID=72520 RepID=W7T083_9STRA|nr:hypothetical protein Naga_100890g1 [Nannochloropsis gaditana]
MWETTTFSSPPSRESREGGREGGGEEGEGREKWLLKPAAKGATTGIDLPGKRTRRMPSFGMLERNKEREWGRLRQMRGGGGDARRGGGKGRQRGKVDAATVGWRDSGPSSVRHDDG